MPAKDAANGYFADADMQKSKIEKILRGINLAEALNFKLEAYNAASVVAMPAFCTLQLLRDQLSQYIGVAGYLTKKREPEVIINPKIAAAIHTGTASILSVLLQARRPRSFPEKKFIPSREYFQALY